MERGFYGSVQDAKCFECLPQHSQRATYYSGTQTALADSGFEGCGLLNARKGAAAVTEVGRHLNRAIRRHRVLIEFLFGSLKKRFSICQRPWPRAANRESAPDVFYACCLLQNFWMRKYGYLRGFSYRVRRELEEWERKLLNNPQVRSWNVDDLILESILDGHADDLYALLEERGVV